MGSPSISSRTLFAVTLLVSLCCFVAEAQKAVAVQRYCTDWFFCEKNEVRVVSISESGVTPLATLIPSGKYFTGISASALAPGKQTLYVATTSRPVSGETASMGTLFEVSTATKSTAKTLATIPMVQNAFPLDSLTYISKDSLLATYGAYAYTMSMSTGKLTEVLKMWTPITESPSDGQLATASSVSYDGSTIFSAVTHRSNPNKACDYVVVSDVASKTAKLSACLPYKGQLASFEPHYLGAFNSTNPFSMSHGSLGYQVGVLNPATADFLDLWIPWYSWPQSFTISVNSVVYDPSTQMIAFVTSSQGSKYQVEIYNPQSNESVKSISIDGDEAKLTALQIISA